MVEKKEQTNSLRSFITMYYLLDSLYPKCKKDDLGALIGAISPKLWEDGMPMDLAILDDWKEQYGEAEINKNNLKKAILNFLLTYEENFGFSFYQVKEYLLNCNEEAIELAIERGKQHIEELEWTLKSVKESCLMH